MSCAGIDQFLLLLHPLVQGEALSVSQVEGVQENQHLLLQAAVCGVHSTKNITRCPCLAFKENWQFYNR